MQRVSGLVLALALAGCAASPPSLVTRCAEPRPQVCTMEYDPVCGYRLAGDRALYSSPCNACADGAVAAYVPGQCPDAGAP